MEQLMFHSAVKINFVNVKLSRKYLSV